MALGLCIEVHNNLKMKIGVVGGGAAGFFTAIAAKNNHPSAQVVLFEKTHNPLAKVKISGGGRCNVTHDCSSIKELCEAYPRGGRKLKKAFQKFDNNDTWSWFESRNIPLKTEPDGRVFPQSNKSQSIVDGLINEAKRLGICINLGMGVKAIKYHSTKFELEFLKKDSSSQFFDQLIIATGGGSKLQHFEEITRLGHSIIPPVPSLFTFNMPDETITELMGVSVSHVLTGIEGTKLKSSGPLLVTHWGMSGPAILKLSSIGARSLSEMNYQYKVHINWIATTQTEAILQKIHTIIQTNPQRYVTHHKPVHIPQRLWLYLLTRCAIPHQRKWNELGKKNINKLLNILIHDVYHVKGKTTFKEEFVTCGGVDLDEIDLNTMQSKLVPNLYFAGEVMDIDAITGGYNFQAAWTTGFIAGKLS